VSTALEKLDVLYDDREALAKELGVEETNVQAALRSEYEGQLSKRAKELLQLHRKEPKIGYDAVRYALSLLSTLQQREDLTPSVQAYIKEKEEDLKEHYLPPLKRLKNG
jgi:hypothetical protein